MVDSPGLPSAGEAMKSLWILVPRMEPTNVGAKCHRDCAVRGWHSLDTPRNPSHSWFGDEWPGQMGGYWSRRRRGGLGVFCLGRPTSSKGHDRIKLKGGVAAVKRDDLVSGADQQAAREVDVGDPTHQDQPEVAEGKTERDRRPGDGTNDRRPGSGEDDSTAPFALIWSSWPADNDLGHSVGDEHQHQACRRLGRPWPTSRHTPVNQRIVNASHPTSLRPANHRTRPALTGLTPEYRRSIMVANNARRRRLGAPPE